MDGAAAVRREISDETDRITGQTKQISNKPIQLSIYSPNGSSPVFSFVVSASLVLLSLEIRRLLEVLMVSFIHKKYYFYWESGIHREI